MDEWMDAGIVQWKANRTEENTKNKPNQGY